MLAGKRILLIVAGGIAAYKSLDLIRRLRERGASVRCVLTAAGAKFVTPLSLAALSGDKVYGDLFSLTDESEMGHIRLSREADLIVIVPATANTLARMAQGLAADLASTVLLATDKPVLAAPSMNMRMWDHPATRANIATLLARGTLFVGPGAGNLACGEVGDGRLAEVMDIVAAIESFFGAKAPLAGRRALVTSGPTFEAIDPVRFIGNRSSGKQGHAIAQALARLGAETTLISGPVSEPDPAGVRVLRIESARQMLDACLGALPADVAVCAAAVSDWRPRDEAAQKMKKGGAKTAPSFDLIENPDILATLSAPGNARPALVVGFAAETENVIANAQAKRAKKNCDWILANDVSAAAGVFGGEDNSVHLISADAVEDWPRMAKTAVAERLAERIRDHFSKVA
ncbi:MAG TPA: bifunctional phosphopantothenoylcysteine decarboxylase/phosphopantothenate--cysteine ligase CoaBC [Alphaproteobacteria bacterium]|jgi:phosphopantothenoylcysteine decarboxylase/phosphopantothenate--cysteine ligase